MSANWKLEEEPAASQLGSKNALTVWGAWLTAELVSEVTAAAPGGRAFYTTGNKSQGTEHQI